MKRKPRKCRRTRRDEAAGLIFRWRVARGSRTRGLFAVLIATGLFALGASFIQVKGKTVRIEHRETARITILTAGQDSSRPWFEWARRNSPFLDRWEPEVDNALREHMAELEDELIARSKYQPLLWPMPEITKEVPLPELFDPARPRLPPVKREMVRVIAPPTVEARVFTEVAGPLELRWENPSRPLHELLPKAGPEEEASRPRELLGLERRFLVIADPKGVVIFCQSLDPTESKLDAPLSRWLHQQRLKADEGAPEQEWGEVRVAVRGAPTEREKP